MNDLKYILMFLILLLSLVFPTAARLEERSKKDLQTTDAGPIVIKSQSLEVDNKQRIVVFTGQVDARRDDITINCDKMLIYYVDQSNNKRSESPDLRIDRIVANGNVKISRADGALAMAEEAVYYERDEKVVLTGKPIVRQGNDFLEGSTITLFLKEKRSIVEGSGESKVRAVLHPRSEKR